MGKFLGRALDIRRMRAKNTCGDSEFIDIGLTPVEAMIVPFYRANRTAAATVATAITTTASANHRTIEHRPTEQTTQM